MKKRVLFHSGQLKIALLVLTLLVLLSAVLFGGDTAYAEGTASAEEELTQSIEDVLSNLDLNALEEYYRGLNEEQKAFFGSSVYEFVRHIVTGEFEFEFGSFMGYLFSVLGGSVARALPMAVSIIAIAVVVSVIGGVKGSFASASTESIVGFAGVALVSVAVLLQVYSVVQSTASLVKTLSAQIEAVFPVLFTLMTAVGASGSVKVYQPAVAVLSVSLTQLITYVILPVVLIMLCFAVVGNLSGGIKLSGVSKFLSSASKWVLYTAFFLFMGFLSVQGITAAVYDNISVRTAKFALSQYVPVIGGYLSEGFNIIAAGSVLIKNAVGLCAIFMLLLTVLPVLMEVVLLILSLRLAAAVAEPFGQSRINGLLESIIAAVRLLVSVILGILFVYFLFLILIIASGNLAL